MGYYDEDYDNWLVRIRRAERASMQVKEAAKKEANKQARIQAKMVWVNKVLAEPLTTKYYESGVFHLPHNEGFGNVSGKRQIYTSN